MTPDWPPLPYADWRETKETLHRYAQVVGKIRMAWTPRRPHWWHVTLYVTERGLSTGPMPHDGHDVAIDLDFLDHRVEVRASDGRRAGFDLAHRPACADFYGDLFGALADVGATPEIDAAPFDLGDSPRLDEDRVNATYDPEAVTRYWRTLAATQRVMNELGTSFLGKASPVHLFWHSFDLAHARYSGRPAPVPAGADPVTAEAYSHEVIAFGFWPGDDRRTPFPAFYSYTAPEPAGLADHALGVPEAAWHDTGNGSLAVLPYDAVRESADPHAHLLAFFEAAYAAGAGAAGWDVDALGRR